MNGRQETSPTDSEFSELPEVKPKVPNPNNANFHKLKTKVVFQNTRQLDIGKM